MSEHEYIPEQGLTDRERLAVLLPAVKAALAVFEKSLVAFGSTAQETRDAFEGLRVAFEYASADTVFAFAPDSDDFRAFRHVQSALREEDGVEMRTEFWDEILEEEE